MNDRTEEIKTRLSPEGKSYFGGGTATARDGSELLDAGKSLLGKVLDKPTIGPEMQSLNEWREDILKQPIGEDIIKDLLPNASTEYMMICGRPGIGKTNLALYLAFCLATDTPFFSHKTKQCKVGYLAFEGTPHKLLNRFDKLAKSFPDTGDYLMVKRSLPFKLIENGTDKFQRVIEGLDVIIIDPLRYIVPFDYTKPVVASHFISTLKECCSESNTIPLLIHHIRKRDKRMFLYPEDLLFEVKGGSEWVDSAGTVLLLEQTPRKRDKKGRFANRNPDDRILYFAKVKDSPSEVEPYRLQFNRDKLMYEPTLDFEVEDEAYLT